MKKVAGFHCFEGAGVLGAWGDFEILMNLGMMDCHNDS